MAKPRKKHTAPSAKAQKAKQPQASKRTAPKNSKGRFEQVIFRDWCKGCGICSAFCPKKVLARDETGSPVIEHPENCIGCRFCELHCPDFAITIVDHEDDEK